MITTTTDKQTTFGLLELLSAANKTFWSEDTMKIFCRYKKLSMYESPAPVIEFNATFAGGALGHSNVSDDDNVQDKLSTGRSPAAGWTPTPTPATLSTGE